MTRRTPQGFTCDMSSEAQSRRSRLATRNNPPEKGRIGKAASPWRLGPMCASKNAATTFKNMRKAKP